TWTELETRRPVPPRMVSIRHPVGHSRRSPTEAMESSRVTNRARRSCARPILLTGGGKFDQDPAARFIGILVSAVAEYHDAELPTWHHPDIGRGVVEAAVFFDDGRFLVGDLPGQRLRVAGADAKDITVRQCHRVTQRLVHWQFVEIGGEKGHHVARR